MASSRQNASSGFDTTGWPLARLIPTAGIRGQEEQEKRATSSLLAVMRAVPEFGHALLKELGAPKSPLIETLRGGPLQGLRGQDGHSRWGHRVPPWPEDVNVLSRSEDRRRWSTSRTGQR